MLNNDDDRRKTHREVDSGLVAQKTNHDFESDFEHNVN